VTLEFVKLAFVTSEDPRPQKTSPLGPS